MQVLIRDLDKDTTRIREEFFAEIEAVMEIGEGGVDTERPGITVYLDHFWFAGEVAFPVFYITSPDFWLEVGGKLDAIRWVHVNHLHLASQVFTVSEAGHYLERIPQNQTIGPIDIVLVELDRFAVFQFWIGEQ